MCIFVGPYPSLILNNMVYKYGFLLMPSYLWKLLGRKMEEENVKKKEKKIEEFMEKDGR